VIATPPLWAPSTTPTEPDSSRRHLRPRPITLALALLATLSAVLFLVTGSAPQLALSGAAWVAITIDAVAARRALRDISIELWSEPLITTADPMTCSVRLHGARRPVVLAPSVRPSVQRFLVAGPEPGMMLLAPRRRGLVHALTIDVTCTGPVGLIECGRRMRVRLNRTLTVGPAPLRHAVDWPRTRAVSVGLVESTPVGDDLYRSVRPYVRGDSRRRVHWRASAHHGTLMVKEHDGTGVVLVRIVVQLDGPGAAAEVALSRAAWVARDALLRGWRTELVTIQPRAAPVARPAPLRSPFTPPPIEVASMIGPVHVVVRRVTDERAISTTLATAMYGPIEGMHRRGTTLLVTPSGDRWL
jgi:uncharacterized protein (DUF58 family)